MIVLMEDIYDQIFWQDLIKKDNIPKHRLQTALNSLSYSYLYLNVKNFRVDQRRVKVLHSLRETCMVQKHGKIQRIVIVNKKDYYNSIEQLFNDQKKI